MTGMQVGTFVLAGQFPGQSQVAALDRAVRSAEVAEEAGLEAVWLAEHHFVPYGVCPSAATLAALLLGRTRRIRIGTAISVLPTAHPVALGEQAALLHLLSGGRFTLGVGRGGPWVDLEVFGGGADAFERGFPEALELLLRWLREPRVAADGERYRFREVPVVPRPTEPSDGPEDGSEGGPAGGSEGGARAGRRSPAEGPAEERAGEPAGGTAPAGEPPVLVACTSPGTVRLAARHGLPMLLGMHIGDQEKAEMVALWREAAREAGVPPEARAAAGHVSAGVAQVGDSRAEAVGTLRSALPGWLRQGLAAHQTLDGSPRRMRDPHAYTELLCALHPVGSPRLCADRLAATAERTGITRFALLVEGSGETAATERNVRRLGGEVLPLLPRAGAGGAGAAAAGGSAVAQLG